MSQHRKVMEQQELIRKLCRGILGTYNKEQRQEVNPLQRKIYDAITHLAYNSNTNTETANIMPTSMRNENVDPELIPILEGIREKPENMANHHVELAMEAMELENRVGIIKSALPTETRPAYIESPCIQQIKIINETLPIKGE